MYDFLASLGVFLDNRKRSADTQTAFDDLDKQLASQENRDQTALTSTPKMT